MKNLRRLAFLALLSVFLSVPGCAHVQPVISTVVTCSGKTIPTPLVDEVYTDIMTENWGDLALTAVPALSDGWADVVCIYDALKGANSALVGHMEKLQAEHVELRVSLRPALPGAAEIAGTPAGAREGGMSPRPRRPLGSGAMNRTEVKELLRRAMLPGNESLRARINKELSTIRPGDSVAKQFEAIAMAAR